MGSVLPTSWTSETGPMTTWWDMRGGTGDVPSEQRKNLDGGKAVLPVPTEGRLSREKVWICLSRPW